MGIEIIAGLIASLLGAFYPLMKKIVEKYLLPLSEEEKKSHINKFLLRIFDIELSENNSYKEKIAKTLATLKNAFQEVDDATVEFAKLIKEKETGIELIEKRLKEMSDQEAALKKKIETLQGVPIGAVPYFEEIMDKREKRSASRDYILFVSGILVSVVVTLVLKFYFGI